MKALFLSMSCMVLLLPVWSYADTISCEGGIVATGDTAVDLIMKCGQPEGKDSHTEKIVASPDRDTKLKTLITVEDWTYNFGEEQFLRIVTLRNGVITGIRTGQRGAAKDRALPGPACSDRVISVGDSKTDILIRCGEPFFTTSHQETVKERFGDASSRTVMVTVEEWTYNFGPQRFMRVITFRNGTVADIRTGGYGR
ncbi:MAG: DUF2845 domain-containing protein [Nitrospirota bacterium]